MPEPGADKIHTIEDAVAIREDLKAAGKTLVLTNGCFDMIHVGHVKNLEAARRKGDFLLVAVNSDASVRLLKGEGRPIVCEHDRAEIIGALGCVDCVVIFSERTAEAVVERLRPDVYVKGGDYSEDEIPEARVVRRLGGRVEIVPLIPGKSTSELVDVIWQRKP